MRPSANVESRAQSVEAVHDTTSVSMKGEAYEHCARVPLAPWPTAKLLRDAATARPWTVMLRERRFVALTLLLARSRI